MSRSSSSSSIVQPRQQKGMMQCASQNGRRHPTPLKNHKSANTLRNKTRVVCKFIIFSALSIGALLVSTWFCSLVPPRQCMALALQHHSSLRIHWPFMGQGSLESSFYALSNHVWVGSIRTRVPTQPATSLLCPPTCCFSWSPTLDNLLQAWALQHNKEQAAGCTQHGVCEYFIIVHKQYLGCEGHCARIVTCWQNPKP